MPTTQQRVVSLPSSVPQSFSPSSARTLLATPARQSPAVRRLSFSLLSARSPGSPATPSRLRLAHLRRQLGKVEAEERAVLDRVREVRREVEEVRWIKARRSQDNPVSTNVKASKWAWSAVIFAFWWIGLSCVQLWLCCVVHTKATDSLTRLLPAFPGSFTRFRRLRRSSRRITRPSTHHRSHPIPHRSLRLRRPSRSACRPSSCRAKSGLAGSSPSARSSVAVVGLKESPSGRALSRPVGKMSRQVSGRMGPLHGRRIRDTESAAREVAQSEGRKLLRAAARGRK